MLVVTKTKKTKE